MMQKLFQGYCEKLQQITSHVMEITRGLKEDNARRAIMVITPLINCVVSFIHHKTYEVKPDNSHEHGLSTSSQNKTPVLSNGEYLKKEAHTSNLLQEVASNSRSIDELKMKVEARCDELEAKTTKIARLEFDILTKKMQVRCLQSTTESQSEEIVKLKHTSEVFEDKVNCLDADVSEKSGDIARLQNETKMISQDIKNKTAQVLSLRTEVKNKTN